MTGPIVAILLVGNEEAIVRQCIEYHLSIGVDAFVIYETASWDSTAKRLRTYASRTNIDLSFASPADVFGASPINPTDLHRALIARAKERFQAEWILKLDADEFWCVQGDNLPILTEMADASCVQLKRRNFIWPKSSAPSEAPFTPAQLADMFVMSRPVLVTAGSRGGWQGPPLNFTRVGPKCLARASEIDVFSPGGHAALDHQGQELKSHQTCQGFVAHYWYSTAGRLMSKARFARAVQNTLLAELPPMSAWQWRWWSGFDVEDVAPYQRELDQQFPEFELFERLKALGRIATCRDTLEALPQQAGVSAEAWAEADINLCREVGWPDPGPGP